jgi:hypothetical protein
MPTIIHFVGRDQLMVRQSEAEVQAAFNENAGRPIALTHQRSGNAVFVNPGQVTYWQGRGTREVTSLHRAGVGRVPSLR